ncbi:MAG: hypothetical protein PHP00_09745 [Thiotrichaceae bacterium]|nr:hypothetical protein [Thiotrichaceae bacterium]
MKTFSNKSIYFALLLLYLIPISASADVVWPSLYLEERLMSLEFIGLGLLVEFIVIWGVFKFSLPRALLADIVANAASSILGIILIPLSGLVWEIFPGLIIYYIFNWGTFNPVGWGASFVLACLVNVALEGYILKRVFKQAFNRKTFYWLLFANACSVGIAFASLWWEPLIL